MNELKNCPFCGKKPEIEKTNSIWDFNTIDYRVICKNVSCFVNPSTMLCDKKSAIGIWNRRRR